MITRGKEIVARIRDGWELRHISNDALPGRWEMRRGRESIAVHWDAIDGVRRHYLRDIDALTVATQEGRFTWSYVPKQRQAMGGLL